MVVHKNNCSGWMSGELSQAVGNNRDTDLLLEELQAADNNQSSGCSHCFSAGQQTQFHRLDSSRIVPQLAL